jgi:hypothetical protein
VWVIRRLRARSAAAVAAFGFLAMIWPFGGAMRPLFTHGNWALLPMAGAALLGAATLRRRLDNASGEPRQTEDQSKEADQLTGEPR